MSPPHGHERLRESKQSDNDARQRDRVQRQEGGVGEEKHEARHKARKQTRDEVTTVEENRGEQTCEQSCKEKVADINISVLL